jgi:hypothetical protein
MKDIAILADELQEDPDDVLEAFVKYKQAHGSEPDRDQIIRMLETVHRMRSAVQRREEKIANLRVVARSLGEWCETQGWKGITIGFDGSGDSGDIESVIPYLERSEPSDGSNCEPNFLYPDNPHQDEKIKAALATSAKAFLEGDDAPLSDDSHESSSELQRAVQVIWGAHPLENADVSDLCVQLASVSLGESGWGGWENNDGAYGVVDLNAEGEVTIHLNERFMDSTYNRNSVTAIEGDGKKCSDCDGTGDVYTGNDLRHICSPCAGTGKV